MLTPSPATLERRGSNSFPVGARDYPRTSPRQGSITSVTSSCTGADDANETMSQPSEVERSESVSQRAQSMLPTGWISSKRSKKTGAAGADGSNRFSLAKGLPALPTLRKKKHPEPRKPVVPTAVAERLAHFRNRRQENNKSNLTLSNILSLSAVQKEIQENHVVDAEGLRSPRPPRSPNQVRTRCNSRSARFRSEASSGSTSANLGADSKSQVRDGSRWLPMASDGFRWLPKASEGFRRLPMASHSPVSQLSAGAALSACMQAANLADVAAEAPEARDFLSRTTKLFSDVGGAAFGTFEDFVRPLVSDTLADCF